MTDKVHTSIQQKVQAGSIKPALSYAAGHFIADSLQFTDQLHTLLVSERINIHTHDYKSVLLTGFFFPETDTTVTFTYLPVKSRAWCNTPMALASKPSPPNCWARIAVTHIQTQTQSCSLIGKLRNTDSLRRTCSTYWNRWTASGFLCAAEPWQGCESHGRSASCSQCSQTVWRTSCTARLQDSCTPYPRSQTDCTGDSQWWRRASVGTQYTIIQLVALVYIVNVRI